MRTARHQWVEPVLAALCALVLVLRVQVPLWAMAQDLAWAAWDSAAICHAVPDAPDHAPATPAHGCDLCPACHLAGLAGLVPAPLTPPASPRSWLVRHGRAPRAGPGVAVAWAGVSPRGPPGRLI